MGDLRIGPLFFTDDLVLLDSSGRDLQFSQEQFAQCKASEMRISSSKSELMVLSQKDGVRDRQMDWCGIISDAGIVSI